MFDLSERCFIQPPSLSRTIPLLVTRGLVRRSTDPIDQRRVVVGLSRQGRGLYQAMVAESAKIYAQLEADFGASRLAEIYSILDSLVAEFEEAGESGDE